MAETKTDKIEKHYSELLSIKDERDSCTDKQVEHYAKYKEFLGKVQELSRKLGEKIEEGRKLLSRK